MHQHLFLKWLWEWFWHPQGTLVWAEANEGLLSIGALASALILALIEQRRAGVAEQLARDADAAADRRAREAAEAADRRVIEANALADRKSREAQALADRKARRALAEAERKSAQLRLETMEIANRRFIDVVTALLNDFMVMAAFDHTIAKHNAETGLSGLVQLTAWSSAAKHVAQALSALLPAAPPNPQIVLYTSRLAGQLGVAHSFLGTWGDHAARIGTLISEVDGYRNEFMKLRVSITSELADEGRVGDHDVEHRRR